MAEVAALLCKWSLDAVQPRLLLAASPRWMTAAVAAAAALAPSRLIQSRLIGIAVHSRIMLLALEAMGEIRNLLLGLSIRLV